MAKSSPLGRVRAALRQEEGFVESQLGKIRDAMAALGGVPRSYARRQAVRKVKTAARAVRRMTAAQRKAVSRRMKAYWSARRKAKARR